MSESTHKFEELLAEPSFQRLMDLIASEVRTRWQVEYTFARGVVLSAIGEPATLAILQEAWRMPEGKRGLAKVVIRRRVLDLLVKDARPRGHTSLPEPDTDGDVDEVLGTSEAAPPHTAFSQLRDHRIIEQVRLALDCFATQGTAQRRQAQLLLRFDLDESTYNELSDELTCNKNALRVRVHKARAALLRHIRGCHPELRDLLDLSDRIHST